jgi:LysR family transcriptional regulator, glycine cleavage system transcriptional activator
MALRETGRFPPLNALRAFEAAARLLSFKKAARELHVTPGAVSHQVKLLEDHLGVALFRRLTRALELTPEAQAMLPKVREGLECLMAAVDQVRARERTTALTVMAPPGFATRWLVPRLARFTDAHPEIQLHVASRNGMIDAGDEGLQVPDGDGAPVLMVRFGRGQYPGLQVEKVFSAVYVPVCSPRLLQGEHPLRKPSDLRFHTLLHDDTVVEEGARPSWDDFLESVGVEGVDSGRGPHFSDASLAMDAAIEGMGVTLAMKPLVRPDVEAGRLAMPFDVTAPTSYAYYLLIPENDADKDSVAAFRSWLLEEAAPERR